MSFFSKTASAIQAAALFKLATACCLPQPEAGLWLCPSSFNLCACMRLCRQTRFDQICQSGSLPILPTISHPPAPASQATKVTAPDTSRLSRYAPLGTRHGGEMGLVAVIIISPFRAADPGGGAPIALHQWGGGAQDEAGDRWAKRAISSRVQ